MVYSVIDYVAVYGVCFVMLLRLCVGCILALCVLCVGCCVMLFGVFMFLLLFKCAVRVLFVCVWSVCDAWCDAAWYAFPRVCVCFVCLLLYLPCLCVVCDCLRDVV